MCHGATVRTYSSDRRAISAFPKRTAGRYTPPLSRRKIQRGLLPAPAQSSASGTSDQLLLLHFCTSTRNIVILPIHISARPWDRPSSRGVRGCSRRAARRWIESRPLRRTLTDHRRDPENHAADESGGAKSG